jgi:predicted dehydrogenase
MKIAFAGTGYINKFHAQAAQNLGLKLEVVVHHKTDSTMEFGKRFGIVRQYESVEALL